MAASTSEAVVKINGALRGASGTTLIKEAKRARERIEFAQRDVPGKYTKAFVVSNYVSGTIEVETLSRAEYIGHLAAIASNAKETLVIKYADPTGNRKTTYTKVKPVSAGDSDFPPPEDSGSAPRFVLRFELVENNQDDALANLIADAVDS